MQFKFVGPQSQVRVLDILSFALYKVLVSLMLTGNTLDSTIFLDLAIFFK